MFFGNEGNAKVLATFLRKAEAAHVEEEVRAVRLSATCRSTMSCREAFSR